MSRCRAVFPSILACRRGLDYQVALTLKSEVGQGSEHAGPGSTGRISQEKTDSSRKGLLYLPGQVLGGLCFGETKDFENSVGKLWSWGLCAHHLPFASEGSQL